MKIKTIIAYVVVGIFIGWILGLWQQAAQRAHRQNCPVCREVDHAD